MTHQEFIDRVNVNITAEEYAAIEVVYMNCDLDKDEFCAMWRKMNRSRVIAAAESRKRERAIGRILDAIGRNAIWHGGISLELKAVNVLSESILNDIESLGIDLQAEPNSDGFRHFKTLAEIKLDIMAIAA
ncbi:MAG: hypothetical protein NC401_10370 [Ruminococcus sp.]|nr:hypothetical protein [Ruminococcus sp.]MCM1438975.1 hypothetical protein [Roseburia sp.]